MTTTIILILTMLLSGFIVYYFLPKILLLSLKNRLLDKVDNRKIHTSVASRLGGASFLPAISISTIIGSVILSYVSPETPNIEITNSSLLIICSMITLYFVGIYDDIVGMVYKEKFFFQFATAIAIVASGNYISNLNGLFGIYSLSPYIGIPFTAILIVFITNALNLIDGIDGLASMLSIMGFAMYSMMFYLNNDYSHCLFCLAALGALAPFFYHNVFGVRRRFSSRIFMGDGGALVIGFLLAVMAIDLWNSTYSISSKNYQIHEYSWVVAFTMLILPCFDVIRVIIARAKSKKPLFLPDRNHFHHKLMAFGISSRRALAILIFVNAIFLSTNITLAVCNISISIIIISDVVLWVLIHLIIKALVTKLNKNRQTASIETSR